MGNLLKSKHRLGALTALRFIAAIIVVLGHVRHDFLPLHDFPENLVFTQAVTFFFVLSGFILTYVYPELPNSEKTKAFLTKRIARLWPLHVSTFFLEKILVAPALVTVGGSTSKFVVALANLLMLHAWVPFAQFFFSYNAPSWSISAEFFFYLCFPLLLTLMRRNVWLPLLISLLVVFVFVFVCNVNGLTEDAQGWNMEGLLYINPLVRILEFITGMMTARLFIRLQSKLTPPETVRSQAIGTGIETFAFALALMFMLTSIQLSQATVPIIGTAGAFWLKNSMLPLAAFNFLILVMACGRGLISKFLTIPLMVLLGDISYAVYLAHYPLLMYRRCFLPQENSMYSLVAFLAVLLILSHLLFIIVERPIRHLITTVVLDDRPLVTAGGVAARMPRGKELLISTIAKTKIVLQGLLGQVLAFFRTPGKSGIFIAELCSLVLMVLCLHPYIDRVTSTEVRKLLSIEQYLAKEVRVGDDLMISRVVTHRNENSAEVELLFRAKKKQNLEYYLYVQLLDRTGQKLYEQSVNFSPLPTKVKAGDYWLQAIHIPIEKLHKAETIGVQVMKENVGLMPIVGGNTDMDTYRLLLSAKSLGRRQIGEPM
ncbi:MAG: acyltransferase [Candidatus Melainabacteria bacterium]|nr:acyltransferase [Candidatus Melainabacteria bacterium]